MKKEPQNKKPWCKRDGDNRICLACGKNVKSNPDTCTCQQHQESYEQNRKYMRAYFQENKKRLVEANRRYRANHPEVAEKNREYQKGRYLSDREGILAKNRAWDKDNRKKRCAISKRYRARHPERARANDQRQYQLHKEEKNQRRGEQLKATRERSPGHRARYNLRSRLSTLISGKGPKAFSIRKQVLLYTNDELRAHLEQQFTPEMNWQNYGKGRFWEIDHIIPCERFDLTQLDQAIQCFALANLRPLPIDINRSRFYAEKRQVESQVINGPDVASQSKVSITETEELHLGAQRSPNSSHEINRPQQLSLGI